MSTTDTRKIRGEGAERILLALRRHPGTILAASVRAGIMTTVPVAIWFIGNVSAWSENAYIHAAAELIVPSYLLVIWLWFAVAWTRLQLDLWMVTTHRLIHVSEGLTFGKKTESWNLDGGAEVTVFREGFLQSSFDYGQVVVRLEDDELTMEDVPHPERVQRIIMEQENRYAALERTNEQHEDLVRFVSHEMKGYLAKNKAAFASIVEGDYGEVPQALSGMAGMALADTDRGVKTVMHLLDEKAAAGNQAIFDFRDIVLSVAGAAEAEAKKKGVALKVVVDPKPCMVKGDEILLRDEVVKNIIENAVQYTPAGSVRVRCMREGAHIALVVEDTGVGITEEDMAKLFTKGGRGAESTKMNPHSTGYGLVAAKKIVEEHGGSIRAESKGTGRGATFTITIPIMTGLR